MPRIRLKPKSPEFADRHEHIIEKVCEMPGCSENAEHKAPKHRGLNEYYHFCFEHAREYNKAWNFFSGMSDTEVQDHVYKSFYGDRPTWKYASPEAEEALYNAAREHYFNGEEPKQSKQEKEKRSRETINTNSPEHEAMAIMGLEHPVTLEEIKQRYKTLAKKHHPDLNKNDPKAEELLKKINMSYTVLKLAFEEYKNLPDQ